MMRSGRPAYQSPCTCQNCCRPLDCLVLHSEDPARPAYPYRLNLFSASQEPGTKTFTLRIALRTRCCENARLLGPSSDRLAPLHRLEHQRLPAVRVRAWTEPRHRRQIVVHLLPCRDPQSKTDSSFLGSSIPPPSTIAHRARFSSNQSPLDPFTIARAYSRANQTGGT